MKKCFTVHYRGGILLSSCSVWQLIFGSVLLPAACACATKLVRVRAFWNNYWLLIETDRKWERACVWEREEKQVSGSGKWCADKSRGWWWGSRCWDNTLRFVHDDMGQSWSLWKRERGKKKREKHILQGAAVKKTNDWEWSYLSRHTDPHFHSASAQRYASSLLGAAQTEDCIPPPGIIKGEKSLSLQGEAL